MPLSSRRISSLVLGGLLFTGTFGAGCAVEEPSALPGMTTPGGGRDVDLGPGAGDNKDLLPPDDGEVAPPVLDAPIRSTTYTTVPVHGMAKPGASVVIEGTANGNIAADVASDGRFCADVKLAVNRTNILSFRTIDLVGKESTTVELAIQQTGTAPAPITSAPESENVAIGGSGSSAGMYAHRNDEDALIDGDVAVSFGGRHAPFTHSATAMVRLSGTTSLDRIKLRAPSDCPFTAPFDVYVTTLDAPSGPMTSMIGWTKLPAIIRDQATASYVFSNPIIASHIAVVWPYDGWSNAGLNCGSYVLGPYYAIGEVEAWSHPRPAPIAPRAPSCTGGGG